jgi:TnpA family transposase
MKIARGRELLTPEQRQAFMQIPEDEWVLGTYYTFSKRDLEIINKRRKEENRLGFAVQLAVLRYLGWPYTHIKSIPDSVIHYISKQIGATPSSLSLYPQRENTLWDHLKEIRNEYDFVTFTLKEYRMTFEYPKLEAILRGQINTKVIKENYEDVLRLAHSISEGTVSASLIMGKLGSYSRQNSLATALREMGRIEKTIFILNYISDESLRRKIQNLSGLKSFLHLLGKWPQNRRSLPLPLYRSQKQQNAQG